MGWLDLLIAAALSVAAAWLIAETVSYFVTGKNLRQLLLEKKSEQQFSTVAKTLIKSNTGHELTFDMFDNFNTNLGSGKVTSNVGISNDIRPGDVIVL